MALLSFCGHRVDCFENKQKPPPNCARTPARTPCPDPLPGAFGAGGGACGAVAIGYILFVTTNKSHPHCARTPARTPRPDSLPGLLWGTWWCYLCFDGFVFEPLQGTNIQSQRVESSSSTADLEPLHVHRLAKDTQESHPLPAQARPTAHNRCTSMSSQTHTEDVLPQVVLPARGATPNSSTSFQQFLHP